MTAYQPATLKAIRSRPDCERAVVLLHGFLGGNDDTWDRLPGLLGTRVLNWDIYTLGYATTFHPDFLGVWSADPDLPTLATRLKTEASIEPLSRYAALALVAHSMGGLVVQRALVDEPRLTARTGKVVLFGTPSGGLRKASWLAFWKRQLGNMANDSEFIAALRQGWADQFEPEPSFELRIVAGEQDQFVPPKSSLGPFPRQFHHVVPGNHLSMVKAADAESPSVRLLMTALTDRPAPQGTTAPLVLAAEIPDSTAPALIKAHGEEMSQEDVVRAALALEQNGRRDEATAFLQRHQALGTDVQGTLAGRIKRMWIENEDLDFAQHALDLYQDALNAALQRGDGSQIYYHAINIAFLEFVAFDRVDRAKQIAQLALDRATAATPTVWSIATQAEANLYLGNRDLALHQYGCMLEFNASPWQHASTALQAGQIASKLKDRQIADKLEEIFAPTPQ